MSTTATSGAPLVSVIVPVFNGQRYLRTSLESILAQTYPRVEVLVMDDASTDGTPSLVAALGDRVRYHRQATNRGIYANTNDGIALARGEYVAVYHADDVYHPRIVEREVALLERYPDAGAVFCQSIFIDPSGQPYARRDIPAEVRGGRPLDYPVIFNALLKHKNRFLRCPSAMVRAAVYRHVGRYRDHEFGNSADLEMWLRIGRRYRLAIIEEYLLAYRQGHDNFSGQYHHLCTEPKRFFQIMDRYLGDGDSRLASAAALRAYEGHRAADTLLRAINHYALGQLEASRVLLRDLRPAVLRGNPNARRDHLIVWFALMGLMTRTRPVSSIADAFARRWRNAVLPPVLRNGSSPASRPLRDLWALHLAALPAL